MNLARQGWWRNRHVQIRLEIRFTLKIKSSQVSTIGTTDLGLVLMFNQTILLYSEFLLLHFYLVKFVKYQILLHCACELPVYALNTVVMSAKRSQK